MLKRILQIKTGDWEKSLSYDQEAFTNGIFKVFTNNFPFLRKGNLNPVLAPTELGSGVINVAKVIRNILPVYTSNLPQFYVFADDGKAYLTDGATVTDVSAQIAAGTYTHRDAAVWKGGIVYVKDTEARFNAIPLLAASDIQLLSGLTTGPHPIAIGADRYCYIGNGNNVARLIISSGTTGNTATVAASLETGYTIRKLINDGRYLVYIADNATALSNSMLKNSCIVAFWDLAKNSFDQIYEFQDSYIAGAEIIGDIIKIITPSGLYVTSFGARPRLVVPFGVTGFTIANNEVPADFHSTTIYKQNFLLWGSGKPTGNDAVYGYGNTMFGKPDRLFQHFTVTSNPISAIGTDNNVVLVAVGASGSVKLYIMNNAASNETVVATMAGTTLDRPYTFHHARIVTRSPISSGASVSLKILNGAVSTSTGTKTIKASETKTNSTDPGEKNLVFDHVSAGDGTDVKAFDEISDLEITTNVAIKEVEVWGTPEDERSSYG